MSTTRRGQASRRTEALSRERIVSAAIALLDASGEGGLTFKTLTERLATGPGAIYWHVAGRSELLAAAADAVVAAALEPARPGPTGTPGPPRSPQDEVRAIALRLFDAVDAHPWVAVQMSTNSWQATNPRIFERIGRQVRALRVPEQDWFTVASVLVQYILGAATQNAANAHVVGPGVDRPDFLRSVAAAWSELDPTDYSFTRAVADQMREHDDREQFLAGIDLALAGITTPGSSSTWSSPDVADR